MELGIQEEGGALLPSRAACQEFLLMHCVFLGLSLLCRENKDCPDPEALQVLWESQAG